MGNLSIRNLDDTVIERLKSRATANRRSMEEEVRVIVSEAVKPSRDEWLRDVRDIQRHYRERGILFEDSTTLIREDRDRR